MEPLDELSHTGQNVIAVVDDTVHIADEAMLLIEVQCVFHNTP